MNIDISAIVNQKLAQMDEDGTIRRKIEESLEKSIMTAITSELESYSFRNGIEDQLKSAVSSLAADCGLSAYNGFIAEKCKEIVTSLYKDDISARINEALNSLMLHKYESVKLSDIFKRYREWVLKNTEEPDKYERVKFTHELDIEDQGLLTRYTCKFADHELGSAHTYGEKPDIEVFFSRYRNEKECSISLLWLDGHLMKDSFKLSHLTDFETFVLNLYYNGTKIIMDEDDVDEDPYFDIDD